MLVYDTSIVQILQRLCAFVKGFPGKRRRLDECRQLLAASMNDEGLADVAGAVEPTDVGMLQTGPERYLTQTGLLPFDEGDASLVSLALGRDEPVRSRPHHSVGGLDHPVEYGSHHLCLRRREHVPIRLQPVLEQRQHL